MLSWQNSVQASDCIKQRGITVNIEELLDHLSKIFPINNQDFEVLGILKKIKSILSDPSFENDDRLTEINERIKEIQNFYDTIKDKELFLQSTLLWRKVNQLLANEELDPEEKIMLINNNVEVKNQTITNESKTSYRIREILSDRSLNIEQKRNSLEAFLITNIKQQTDLLKKNTYKLALKIALYDRVYYVDELCQLERRLLTLPCGKVSNPDFVFSNFPSKIQQIWHYINSIRSQISACFDGPGSYCSKLEELVKLISILTNKYSQLEADPDTTHEELGFYEKTKDFILKYLSSCASSTKSLLVQKSEHDWSLWASAALESLSYLDQINSSNYLRYIGGNVRKQQELIAIEVQIHTTRAEYFTSQSKSFKEQIGCYVEHKLTSSTSDLSSTLSKFSDEPSEDVKMDDFITAHSILINHKTSQNELPKLLETACAFESRGHSLGTFIRYVTYVFIHPLSEKILHEYLNTLQSIGVHAQWRNHIADLWLCLADFLIDQYRDSAFLCLDQINDRYPLQSVLYAKLKRAQFSKNILQIESCEKEVAQLKETEHASATQSMNISPLNPKRDQFLLCKLYTTSNAITTEFITELLQNENPYCIAEVISLLESELPEHSCVKEAVKFKYGETHTNPLALCENVLNKKAYNAYLVIWKKLIFNAIEKEYSPSVKQWKDNDFSPDNIRFKLLNTVRSKLHRYMFKHDVTCVIPGGCNILSDLDFEIQQVTERIIAAQHQDKRSNSFAFARNRGGLREAIYALLLLEDGNYNGALAMAQLSISIASSINAADPSPKTSSHESMISPRAPRVASGESHAKRSLFGKHSKLDKSPRQTETTSRRRATFALPSAKHSVSAPSLVNKSPRALDDGITTSSNDQSHFHITHPTCLGHLIKAIVIWDTRLKDNKERRKEDITSFIHSLKDARDATDPQEQSFILGMIWLLYFDRKIKNTEEDNFILTPEELSLLKYPNKILSPERLQYVEQNAVDLQLNLTDQCILEIIKQHFESACVTKSGHSTMFPPAIIAIYKYIMYYRGDFACGNADEVENKKRFWAKLLKEAVLTHGYLPGLTYYAQSYAYAEDPKPKKSDELLNIIELTSDTLRLLHEAFSLAEKYIHIEPDQNKDIVRQIKSHEESEKEIALRIPTDIIEIPKAFDSLFQKLHFEMKNHHSTLMCSIMMSNGHTATQCFSITCNGTNAKSTLKDCVSLKEKFERAAFIYSCCKKVSFSKKYPVVLLEDNRLILKHADIAIIGLIRLAEAKDTILKWTDEQIEPLIHFLKEASTFPSTVWQWDNTFTRLQEFIANYTNQDKLLI